MEFALCLISSICWAVVYFEIIRVGFKEKTYGMPLVALALNFSWEVVQGLLGLKNHTLRTEDWINVVWVPLDFIIVITYFKFGKKDFPKDINQKYFLPWTALIFLMSFALQYFFVLEFKNLGSWYSAFIQNLVMSVAFINLLHIRKSPRGQNLTIATLKWLGTLTPTILYGLIYGNKLVLVLGIFCSVFDLIYIHLLILAKKTTIQPTPSHLCSQCSAPIPFVSSAEVLVESKE